ncbi:MAG: hypothetical protein SGJ27_03720 [Candidatus Melainabacteria bacterium]|nr:hypothetical protein [Candidatus Melainabacteria bacterium]
MKKPKPVRAFDFQFTDILVSRETWQKIRVPVIGTFLFLQLSVFYLYLFLPNQVAAKLLEPVQRTLGFLCLYQGYGVFSPNPAITNSHILATVTYDDNSSRLYPLVRIDRITLLEKLTQERHRKFLEDNIPQAANIRLLNDVARFVARQCDDLKPVDSSGSKPRIRPQKVTLIYYFSEVPAITDHKPNVPHFNKRILCTYPVQEEDLN